MLAREEITKNELCKFHVCSKGAIRLFFLLNWKGSRKFYCGFCATSAVRYKIANLAFEEMLKGTEVRNISMTATGRVSDYIPTKICSCTNRTELSVVINANV